jgi:kinetochore protein Nuf2
MSIPDIINSLAGWNMPVSQEQLIRPSPDFVQTVYCACLQQITNISHESINEQIQSALAVLEDQSSVRSLFLRSVLHSYQLSGLVRIRPRS